jgi:uncharacterized protein YxjI
MIRRRSRRDEPPEGAPAGTRYLLREKLLSLGDDFWIENDRGERIFKVGDKVATVKKAFVTPVRDRFTVDLEGGGDLEVEGNILDHEYQITRGGVPVANISKRWFRVRDSYGVAVVAGQDDALVLAVTVCIDHLTSHDH